MNIKLKFIGLVLLLMGQASFAGDRKGNGADFIMCPSESYLYDFYENKVEDFKWEGSELELVEYIFDKIAPLSKGRFEEYQNQARSFFKEVKFVTEAEIGSIGDIGAGTIYDLPKDCRIVQGVLQKIVVFGSEKRYLINEEAWKKLSVVHRAGVIVHELIYRELQSRTSYDIRKFNSFIFSHVMDEMPVSEFYKMFIRAGYKWLYLHDFPMDAQTLIWNDGPIRAMSTFPGKTFAFFNQKVLSKKHMVDTYSNGFPRLLQYEGQVKFENDQHQFHACNKPVQGPCKVIFNRHGRVIALDNVAVSDKLTTEVENNKFVTFNENGDVDEIH